MRQLITGNSVGRAWGSREEGSLTGCPRKNTRLDFNPRMNAPLLMLGGFGRDSV